LITFSDDPNHLDGKNSNQHNAQFPFQGTPLLGRTQEIQEITELLQSPEVRLVTLTGPGGVGKTRLAFHLSATLATEFPNGVFIASLAALSDPVLVIPAITRSLGISGANEANAVNLLQAFFSARPTLLIVDNFEHLLNASPLLLHLLEVCPPLKLLVTSRAILHLSYEYEYPLSPLALPDLVSLPDDKALRQCASVELFIQRAQRVTPDFLFTRENGLAIAEICVRLDGLPLAIELAATRIKLFTPQMLLTRLNQRLSLLNSRMHDTPARHQTLRANLDWSYHLLSAREQRLFRWLAVFVGGCTLQAVEGFFVGSGVADLAILEDLTALLEKSLLSSSGQHNAEMRFFLLETIREYAWECLEQSGEMLIAQQAHANYYLRLMEQAAPEFEGAEQPRWVERIAQDYPNLRAGLSWFLRYKEEQQMHEQALRLAGALASFWMTGERNEGCMFLEQALSGSASIDNRVRAKAILELGGLFSLQGKVEQAEPYLKESLALARLLHFSRGIVTSLNWLAYLALIRGAYLEVQELLHESLILARQDNNASEIGFALDMLSTVLGYQGEYEQATHLAEESLRFYQHAGNRQRIADALGLLGLLAFYQGRLSTATSLYEACLAAQQEVKDAMGESNVLRNLGLIAVFQQDYPKARSLLERGLRLRLERGEQRCASEYQGLGRVAFGEGNNREAYAYYQQSLTCFQQIGDPLNLAFCLEGLAELVVVQGQQLKAAYLLGYADAQWQAIQALRPPVLQQRYEATATALSAHLGKPVFVEARQQGQHMEPATMFWLAAHEDIPNLLSVSQPLPAIAPAVGASETLPEMLTEREREIFRLLAAGLTKPQIADRLTLSFHTVNAHVRSIYTKVGVSSRSAATRYALEHHLA